MTTKLELVQAAQSAAAMSVELKTAKVTDAKKQAFEALGIPHTNWRFFSDHFDGARQQYVVNSEQPIEPEAPAKTA
jgi:hypothetical protein